MKLGKAIVLAMVTIVLYTPSIKSQSSQSTGNLGDYLRRHMQFEKLVKSIKAKKTQDSSDSISYESSDCFMEIKDKPSPLCYLANIHRKNVGISKLTEKQIKKLPKEQRIKIANREYISHDILFSGQDAFTDHLYTFSVKPDGTISYLHYTFISYFSDIRVGKNLSRDYAIENGKCGVSEQAVECTGTIKPL
jgi:hypothetical protein